MKHNFPYWHEIISSVKRVIKFLLKKPKHKTTTKCFISFAFIPPFTSISSQILSALPRQQPHCASADKCLGLISGTQSVIRQQGHKRTKQPNDYCIMLKGIEVSIYAVFCCIISVKKPDPLRCGVGEWVH